MPHAVSDRIANRDNHHTGFLRAIIFAIPLLLLILLISPAIASADPITITTTSLPNGQVNSAYNNQVNASGGTLYDCWGYDEYEPPYIGSGYVWELASGSLPPGVSLTTTNGGPGGWWDQADNYYTSLYPGQARLVGTATQAGNYTFTLRAKGYYNDPVTRQFTITINGQPLNITTTSMPDGQVNYSYSKTLTAVGGATPYTWSVISSSLPAGLSIISSTGVVTGTPTTNGTTNVTFKAVSNDSQEDTQALSIYIASALSITTASPLPPATLSNTYNTTINSTGGILFDCWGYDEYEPPYIGSGYRPSIISGSLPAGISLTTTNGGPGGWWDQADNFYTNELYPGQARLVGTPTQSGAFPFTLQVVDYLGVTTTKDYILAVSIPQLNITTISLPEGEQGYPYSAAINYTGGLPPYQWSVISGSLPAGLGLGSPLITGTGTVTGTFDFTLQVTSYDQQTATKALSIYLAPHCALTTQSPLPSIIISQSYNTILNATGGILYECWGYDEYEPPYICSGYRFSVISGAWPTGINMVSTNGGPGSGWWDQSDNFYAAEAYPGLPKLTGAPVVTGIYNAVVQLTDYLGAQSTINYSLTVNYDFNIDTQTVAHPHKDVPFYFALSASGAPGPYNWSVISGSLPAGLTLDSATGILTGTSTAIEQCYVTFQVAATDPVLNPIAQKQLLIDARDTWDNTTGGDHQGNDWNIDINLAVGGEHRNIGKLTIGQGVTVTVQAGSDTFFEANEGIDIEENAVVVAISDKTLEFISRLGYIHMWPGSEVIARNLIGVGLSPGANAPNYNVAGNGASNGGRGGLGDGNTEPRSPTCGTKHGLDNNFGSRGGSVVPPGPVDPVGGPGGRAVFTAGKDVIIEGLVDVSGGDGEDGVQVDDLFTGGAGGGSGGGILIKAQNVSILGNAQLLARGGNGGNPAYPNSNAGGGGGGGRIKIACHFYADLNVTVCAAGGYGGHDDQYVHAQSGEDGTISILPTHAGGSGEGAMMYTTLCPPPSGTQATVPAGGSDVDLTSGNLNMNMKLTHIVPVNGLPHNFTIYYNSAADNTSGPLGSKWTHSFNHYITPILNGQILFYTDGTGRIIVFDDVNYDNEYESYPVYGAYAKIYRTVVDNVVIGYQLLTKSRDLYTFNEYGQLVSIEDSNGNTVTCAYTENTITVTISGNRTITIQFTNNLISQILDPESLITKFSYDNGKLIQVAQGPSDEWKYLFTYYTNTDLIETKTEPYSDESKKNVVTYGYEEGRLASVSKVINGQTKSRSFSYNADTYQATIADFDNKSAKLNYDYVLGTWTDYLDADNKLTQNEFNSNGNLLSRIMPNGNRESSHTYDARGNVLTITNALSYTTTFTYTDTANPDLPTMIIDAAGIVTSFTYDASGNLLTKIGALGTGVEQKTEYQYYIGSGIPNGKKGQLWKVIRDPADKALTTEYEYSDNGYQTVKTIEMVAEPNIVYTTSYKPLGQVDTIYCPRSGYSHIVYTDYDYRGNPKSFRTYRNQTDYFTTTLDYDLMDRLTKRIKGVSVTDIETDYDYDNQGWLKATTLKMVTSSDIITQYEYYDNGRMKKTTDPEGATTEYFYKDNGWLDYSKGQLNASTYAYTYYEYDNNGNNTKITDPELHSSEYSYTVLDQLSVITNARGYTTKYSYNNVGLLEWMEDGRGNKTYNYYDELRRLTHTRTPQDNITVAYKYDSVGRTEQVIGPWYDAGVDGNYAGESANVTNYTYDRSDRVIETWVNSHPKTYYGYDKAGNVTTVTDTTGVVISYQYDRCKHLTKMTVDPSGLNEQTKGEYDAIGRFIRIIGAYDTDLSQTTEYVYDNADRVTKIFVYPSDSYTEDYNTDYTYYKTGQVKTITDVESNTTSYDYDKGGRLEKTTDANGDYARYVYDKDGLCTDVYYVRDISEINTHYDYYPDHLLYTTEFPGFSGTNTIWNYYDENGNLTSQIDAKNQTFSYQYDLNNRLTNKSYSGYSASYTYDSRSNLLTTTDANTDTENQYDDLNRLTITTDKKYSPNKTIAYTYYENGTRESMDGPESGTGDKVEYTYDNAKRLKTVELNGTQVSSYTYNALGLMTNLTLGNGAYTDYEYDSVTRWLDIVTNTTSTGTVISSFAYQHDLVGNRISMTLANGDVVNYDYDDIYQLTNEARTGSITYTMGWTYDNVGNRLTQDKWDGFITTTTTYTYKDSNQLWYEITGGVTTYYDYDANGNQIGKTIGANTWQWGYDYENRQISYTDPITSANNASYVYDAGGTRISKTVNSVTEKYILDGANVIADYDGSDNLVASYVTPFLDQNISVITNSNTYYYMQDGLGSVRNIVSSVQSVVNSYDYYAFGEALSQVEGVNNRYRFTSREWDGESANYYYRARQYNPSVGRFTSRDPIEYSGGINLYSYVQSNPGRYIDPLGEILTVSQKGDRATVEGWLNELCPEGGFGASSGTVGSADPYFCVEQIIPLLVCTEELGWHWIRLKFPPKYLDVVDHSEGCALVCEAITSVNDIDIELGENADVGNRKPDPVIGGTLYGTHFGFVSKITINRYSTFAYKQKNGDYVRCPDPLALAHELAHAVHPGEDDAGIADRERKIAGEHEGWPKRPDDPKGGLNTKPGSKQNAKVVTTPKPKPANEPSKSTPPAKPKPKPTEKPKGKPNR